MGFNIGDGHPFHAHYNVMEKIYFLYWKHDPDYHNILIAWWKYVIDISMQLDNRNKTYVG